MTDKLWVLPDTNVLLSNPNALDDYNLIIIGCVLREVEKHKSSQRQELAYQARIATRYIKNRRKEDVGSIRFIGGDYDAEDILGSEFHNAYFDNQIVAAGLKLSVPIITYDMLLQFKAESFDIEVIEMDENIEDDVTKYTGIKELFISNTEEDNSLLASLYQDPRATSLDLVQNQYLLIWDKEKPHYNSNGDVDGYDLIDSFRYDGEGLVKLKFKPTEDMFMGKTKPINIKQKLAFDLMQNKDVVGSLILGNAGSGKDHIIAAHMMQALQREEIDKIIFVRNTQPLKDSGETGFLKGDLLSKMMPWIYPLADQIGGMDAVEMLIEKGKIEVQHFESIRGRSFNNVGVWCTEIQTMTDYHAKVLVSRMGKDSILLANGDIKQTDSDYNKHNSAINTLKKLKGNKMFGVVTLDRTERSDFAALAEIL